MDAVPQTAPLPLPDHSLSRARLGVLALASRRTLRPREILVREGDLPAAVHVVERGAIGVSSTALSGRRATVAVLGPGDAYGQEALLGEGPTALVPQVEAIVASRIASLPLSRLRHAMAAHPQVTLWLAGGLARRLATAERRLARTLQLGVAERLMALFRDLSPAHGTPLAVGTRLNLPLSQEMLASMVGATRESVNRALRAMAARGEVARSGRRYVLLFPPVQPGGRPS